MRTTLSLGWTRTPLRASLRQGADARLRITLRLADEAGELLPSYDGFTARLALARPRSRATVLTLDGAITPEPDTGRIHILLTFAGTDTRLLSPGDLTGDLRITTPWGDAQYPLDLQLTLERGITS